LSISASRNSAGEVHVTFCNLDPARRAEVDCKLRGIQPKEISGRVLTAEVMQAHNTFERPDSVRPVEFKGASRVEGGLKLVLPAKSVVAVRIN
jgi:alpha-N-arabinofuranosidase